jgi:uncharacterized protein (DUF342 family)
VDQLVEDVKQLTKLVTNQANTIVQLTEKIVQLEQEKAKSKKKSGTPLGGRDPQISVRVKNIHVSLHASWKSSQREKQEAADKASMDQRNWRIERLLF